MGSFAIPAERPFLRKVANCIRAADWNLAIDIKRGIIYSVSGDKECTLNVSIVVYEKPKEIIQGRIIFERNVPAERRQLVATWCNARNWSVNMCSWCLDFNDGELQIHYAVDLEGMEVTPKFMDNFLKVLVKLGCRGYAELCEIVHGVRKSPYGDSVPRHAVR